jgi:hypothetical protein
MAGNLWSEEELATAMHLAQEGFSLKQIAAKIGRSVESTRSKLSKLGTPIMKLRYGREEIIQAVETPAAAKPFFVEDAPDQDLSAEDIIEHRLKAFERREAYERWRRLIPVEVKIDGPIGIAHLGDPHIDDDGCDLKLLLSHIELVNSHPAVFAANAGDVTNNWVGRLAKLYAKQSTTEQQSWKLAEWFINSVHWLYIIGGNHDAWSGGTDPLKWFTRQAGVTYQMDGARIGLRFPNGRECRINARHDHRGHSQFNKAHGPMKAAFFGYRDHIYTAGHLHTDGYIRQRLANVPIHAFRVGSYKRYDDFASTIGAPPEEASPAYMTVIDPSYTETDDRFITTFADLEAGLIYLKAIRGELCKQ